MNAATHYVLGGASGALDAAAEVARSHGARIVRLKVGSPAHTSWLHPAAAAFEREIEQHRNHGTDASDPRRHRRPSGAQRDRRQGNRWQRRCHETVNWRRCIAHAVEMGVSAFLELGPGNALSRIVHESFPKVQARSLDDFRTVSGAITTIRRMLQ